MSTKFELFEFANVRSGQQHLPKLIRTFKLNKRYVY
jgi:hypothetical protein